ncbi:ImpA family type VI secretion-associated protein [Paraburkholderia monticola]|uniref:ImpA family type VI secretion-associated protein n=1 Tax=Paraburkholderia monticola TaxID=1399968 RepID=A0A149PK40_9BURK|nr:type VI secretion system tip protein TssI/VgrG [Paraburkholderia monticola]KXU85417.1 ImpA family type VI secretion-associated protein [Paraburkholderia monticola]
MSTPSQSNWFASVSTPFGADVLLLDGFGGREAISELFRFDLRMRSTNKALDPAQIVGQGVTVTLKDQTGAARYFNGIVTRFAHAGADAQYGFYSAELAPRLWLLTLGQDRVIWQNLTALDIIKSVLGTFGVTFEDRTKRTSAYGAREYCVQYDESAFDFISRLMEEEGIFYFFTFADGAHTLVLADDPSAHDATPAGELYFASDANAAADAKRLESFTMARGVVPGEHIVSDYDYTTPATMTSSSKGSTSLPTGARYTFPGRVATAGQATHLSTTQLEAHNVTQQTGQGGSGYYGLAAGATFTLSGHPDDSLNVSYVTRSVRHMASNTAYSNEFDVFPATVPFRAPLVTRRPLVVGTHTAKVVGPKDEEIWADAQGRIKLKFHWDRTEEADQNSSCWVRVAQSVAGPGWGHLFLPRVGQEVVVSYVDGDPDRPLVTGCVYNGENAPPVALPSLQTQSVMRSRSSKNGTAGNEIRMEDKLDSEELYLHAQKDMTVEIENALSTTVKAGAETHVVQKGDRSIEVSEGKETHTVKGTRALDVTGDETHTNHAKFTHSVTGDHAHTVNGNYTLKVGGNLTIEVTGSVSIKAGTSFASEAGTTHASKATTTLSTEGMTVSHKASAQQTVDGGGQLALKGGMVQLN